LVKAILDRSWKSAKTGADNLVSATKRGGNQTAVWITAAVTNPGITLPIEQWSGRTFNTFASVYSKAIDGDYAKFGLHFAPATEHRILDGHDLVTAFERSMDALPHDTFLQEVTGYFHAMASDMSSVMGLPLFTMSKDHLDSVLQFSREIGISSSWTLDFLHVNTIELFGSAFPVLAAIFHLKTEDKLYFDRLAGSLGFGSLVSANPIGATVALVMLALSIRKARRRGEKVALRGLGAGALRSAGIYAATSILGPIPVALAVALFLITFSLKKSGKLDNLDQASKSVAPAVSFAYRRSVGLAVRGS